jgi:outer membrane protein assembly factor BamE
MRKIVAFVVPMLIAGCGGLPVLPGISPYKIDIQQGNHVTQDMVEKLKPGMTRAQVRFVLGTPLVVDPFRDDRWDYVYVYNKRGEVVEQRHMSVIFKDDKLVRIEGDVVPAAPATQKPKPAAAAPKPEAGQQAGTDAAKPEATKVDPAKSGATGAGDGADKPEPQPEARGFFGRMLERLGF